LDAVPAIDLRDGPGFADPLREALEHFGFVRVRGHGIAPALFAEVHDLFERFFALPEAQKQRYGGVAGGARGFTRFGVEHARDSAEADLKEFFHVGRELPPGHPLADRYPDNLWPSEVPGLRAAVLRLCECLDACADSLLRGLARSFSLDEQIFAAMLRDGNSILRALHYPPLAAGTPAGALRAAPHEDINLITLLPSAKESGLELQTNAGEWLAVETGPNEIVVDTGDMLARVTNDILPATRHRVVNPVRSNVSRYAMPYFAHPYPSCDLSVLPAFVREQRPARYEPTTAQAFLDERLAEIGLL